MMTKNTTASKSRIKEWKDVVRKDFKINKSVYYLLIPVFLFYAVFMYAPMYGALIAFKDFSPVAGAMGSPWVGFKHFASFFNSPSFSHVLLNTLRISFSSLVFGFPAPIILALLINELKGAKFAKVIQNLTYLPHFISLVVVCGMVKDFTRNTGVVTYVLSLFGFPEISMLNYPEYFVPVYVISDIWQQVGWGSIIYLAALTGIDASQYEAAEIDGAGKWKQMLHVTLPGILPTISIMLILRIGGILSVGYEKIILLYNDATLEVADVISTYVYQKGLLEQSWSFSTAVGLFNSVINFIFLIFANTVSRKVSDSALW